MNVENHEWPTIDENILQEDTTNIVVQVNGKKRGLINSKRGINEIELIKLIEKDEQLKKYLDTKIIKRKIYIKNKLMNLII